MSFISTAHAMGAQPAGGDGNLLQSPLMPLILIFVVFYFLLIRPRQKKAKEHKIMLEGLKKGDAVITAGGMLGRIIDIQDDVMLVDLGETKVRMPRQYLTAAPERKQAAPAMKKEPKKGRKEAARQEAAAEAIEEAPAEARAEAPEETAQPAGEAAPAAEETQVVSGDDKDKPAV